ncbi:MAG: inosine/xanthosine triphosphatase [bacterium]|nr:inosine/xanthosine triphosphatase [bacterium]
MKTVIIASKNPVKMNAVKRGFEQVFTHESFSFEGISVSSGVPDQPIGYDETLLGAKNRAKHAMHEMSAADYWVGIEGGVERNGEDMEVFACIHIRSQHLEGNARTGTFFLPPKIIQLVNEGYELGQADDIVFGRENSKQGSGSVGILTNDLIDRTHYYMHATVLALIPFMHPELYLSHS